MMRSLTRHARWMVVAVGAIAIALVVPSVGSAAVSASHWLTFSQQAPTEFHSGDTHDFYEIVAKNDGNAPTSEPITVTDTLPAGVVVNAESAYAEVLSLGDEENELFSGGCERASSEGSVTVTCRTGSSVPVGRSIVVNINVGLPAAKVGDNLVNTAVVSGGGAPEANVGSATPVTEPSVPVPFGASFASDITGVDGGVDTQAGSHPFSFTTMMGFNVASVNPNEQCNGGAPSCAELNAQAKDVEVALPPGLLGNPTAIPYCTQVQFEQSGFKQCPPATQVGSLYLYFYGGGTAIQYAPVYNIEPPPGQPAELGFSVSTSAHIPIFFHVRSDEDYGVTADVANINQFDAVRMAFLTIWGNPSDEAHNPLRLSVYGNCHFGSGCPSGVASPKPFLRLPTSCTAGSLSIPLAGDSWQDNPLPSAPFPQLANSSIAGMTGCDALTFEPSVTVSTDTHQAGAAARYTVDVKVPQHEEPEELATPDVRDAEVTLPEGTTVSPSAANGLSACSDEQFGLKVRAKGHCPAASRIGSVKITTPLLASKVKGNVYVGAPECSPCSPTDAATGRMVRVLLEAEAEGVIIKQAGYTRIDQSTGRLATVFKDTPQLPFSDLELSLEPDPNASLANPVKCGPAITDASLTPWSSSNPTAIQSNPVEIEGCTNAFSPAFEAGTTPTAQAGAFSGVTMTLSRNDGEQSFGRVSVTTPPGLLGVLKSIEQCPEAQANAGTCSAGSLIGSGSIILGPGAHPLTVGGSKVYLTGPYAGKPFGLSVVTPTVAGPFVLSGNVGNGLQVVRAAVAVDPHTGALTVASDPLPQALNGVPLYIRTINVDVNHDNFTFNPTNCDAMAVTGTITSATGTVSNVSSSFQATGCAALPFKPKFTVSTKGKTSKKNGASLHVHVTSGKGQANIGKVKVNLPIQLPSRLSTLQKACIDKVFDANPASCAAVSIVGKATAVTPLLARPLTGSAYLVSHAGAAFPDLEVVLQGEGITLILDGNTNIKKGITSSTFKAVPDAPIDSFDLNLPEGPHSALAAFGNLCTSKLNMPTVITGQNGVVVRQTTRITATGCPRHAKAHAGKKA
jgi:uncharacterized repeat protein (TIGR01451 family)